MKKKAEGGINNYELDLP